MQQMFNWFEAKKIKPRIWKTFKLEDFQDAMVAVLDRAAIGRVAVVMDEEARRLGQ
jgi:D-arabinose 1-dehydrogenase-like Zn-dependent alcohol dehydrogenase